jgi:hypothetical protein
MKPWPTSVAAAPLQVSATIPDVVSSAVPVTVNAVVPLGRIGSLTGEWRVTTGATVSRLITMLAGVDWLPAPSIATPFTVTPAVSALTVALGPH